MPHDVKQLPGSSDQGRHAVAGVTNGIDRVCFAPPSPPTPHLVRTRHEHQPLEQQRRLERHAVEVHPVSVAAPRLGAFNGPGKPTPVSQRCQIDEVCGRQRPRIVEAHLAEEASD